MRHTESSPKILAYGRPVANVVSLMTEFKALPHMAVECLRATIDPIVVVVAIEKGSKKRK